MTSLEHRSSTREFVIAGLAIVIAVFTGVDWLGKPLRLVQVVTLVGAGMVAGTALTRALALRRRGRAGSVDDGAA